MGDGMRDGHSEVPTVPHELVELVPEQQEALHRYFRFTVTSDSHDCRTFSDQFL